MQTIEAKNLVVRPFELKTYRTPEEIFTTAYEASTYSGNTIVWNVRSPSSSALLSSVVYVRVRCAVTVPAR